MPKKLLIFQKYPELLQKSFSNLSDISLITVHCEYQYQTKTRKNWKIQFSFIFYNTECRLELRRNYFSVRVVDPWNKIPANLKSEPKTVTGMDGWERRDESETIPGWTFPERPYLGHVGTTQQVNKYGKSEILSLDPDPGSKSMLKVLSHEFGEIRAVCS